LATGIPARLTAAEGRKFAFTLAPAFLLLAGLLFWRGHDRAAMVLGGIGTFFLLAGLFVPAKLGPVHRGWMGFALALSKFTTPIFMGIVYFLVVTPIGLLMALFGKRPMAPRRQVATHWIARADTGGRGGMDRQF
jgi:hypothetical protein